MARVRFKSPEFEVATYDGKLVGIFDAVSGQVVPGTCPAWFPALTEELETLKMVEVVEGKFVQVGEQMFHGHDGKWEAVDAGARMLCAAGDSQIVVVSGFEFMRDYEPA